MTDNSNRLAAVAIYSTEKLSLRQSFEKQIIRIAIAPVFTGFERLDDRMTRRVIMLRRVTVRRIVAASDVSADLAETEVYPSRADL